MSEYGGMSGAYCPSCGTPHGATDRFCPGCGLEFDGSPRRSSNSRRAAVAVAVVLLLGAGGFAAAQMRGQEPGSAAGPTPSTSGTGAASSPTPSTQTGTPTPSPTVTPSASSETPATFPQLFSRVRSGVVRIDVSICDGGGTGTGFLVDDDLVVTAAHVVDGAASLGLTFGDEAKPTVASGIVVGIDREADMAMIRADRGLKGHVFGMAEAPPGVGQQVVAIGFPRGEPMTLTQGIVSGLNRTISFGERIYGGLIQTDAAINPGNSGGPMLDLAGSVQGVADAVRTDAQGIAFAIPASTVQRLTAQWRDNTASVVDAACDDPTPPLTTTEIEVLLPDDDPLTIEVTDFFVSYFTAINSGDYDQVWGMMSPNLRPPDPSRLAESLSTTIDFEVVVHDVKDGSGDTAKAHVTFISTQAPGQGPEGQTCTMWDLDYILEPADGSWQIRRGSGHAGEKAFGSC